MNEFDLQVKIVSFLRAFYPDVLFSSTHGELQDTSSKRITCNMKGYLRGVPDLFIMETNNIDARKQGGVSLMLAAPAASARLGTTS